jgi:hypothetical protein
LVGQLASCSVLPTQMKYVLESRAKRQMCAADGSKQVFWREEWKPFEGLFGVQSKPLNVDPVIQLSIRIETLNSGETMRAKDQVAMENLQKCGFALSDVTIFEPIRCNPTTLLFFFWYTSASFV